ncbi:hypothetical protein ACSX1A_10440 [Pontibacter sp. MBLB2868]|uniref:hypothetical protein n=1 Tax=Pontibacter sp. MBLB2868 TaxID=3451555 RepID=UPI003F74DB9C
MGVQVAEAFCRQGVLYNGNPVTPGGMAMAVGNFAAADQVNRGEDKCYQEKQWKA